MKKFLAHPPLPSEILVLKDDCGHYCSQLGFGITAAGAVAACGGGTGFIQDGRNLSDP